MAVYYIDGSVSGSAGVLGGSGTEADPWTCNSGIDLLEKARLAIVAAGIGSAGDTVIVKAGGLTNTAPMTYESGWNQTKPFVLRPLLMDGTQIIDFDLGLKAMYATNIVQQGQNFYFCNFHKFGNSTSTGGFLVFNLRHWAGFYFCTFDGADAEAGGSTGLIYTGSGTHIIGCRFINDGRGSGLLIQGSSGCTFRNNYIEINYANYSMYTYNSEFSCNVVNLISASHLGAILPIQGGTFNRNTFYGADADNPTNSGGAIYLTADYEHNIITNNVFVNCRRSVYINSSDQHNISVFAGNYEFNTADHNHYPNSTNTTFMTNNNNNMATSPLIDPANGDYRPTDLLIGKGFNLETYSLQGVSMGGKTIGAIEGSSAPVFGQYSPFGGQ